MAILRSYSATFEQTALANAAVTRWRFNEDAGSASASDSVDSLDGDYESGAAPGAAGSIGDGAASFNGSTGFVLVETLSGTVRIATLGDSLADPDNSFQPDGQSFADDLPTALEARGLTVDYFDHAVSGDRTDQGLARVDDVLANDPDVVILELGTNDALGKINPQTVEDNLRDIIGDLQAGGVQQILLTGTFGFYPGFNGGSGYDTEPERAAFEAKFAEIADDTPGVVLLKDSDGSDKFLGGERIPDSPDTISGGVLASGDPQGLNDDGLHPNANGVDYIVPRIVPQTIALGSAAGAVTEPLLLASGAFEMWFTIDTLDHAQTLFAKNSEGQGTGGQVAAFVRSTGALVFALGSGTDNFHAESSQNTVQVGEPTHLVANFGTDGMHVFVNGVEVATNGSYEGGLIGNFEQLVIGADNGSNPAGTPATVDALEQFFDGTIDEVAVYDRALTVNEIQNLFDAGELGRTVLGTAQADTIFGGSDREDLRGGGGADLIIARGGDDTLRGGGADDDLRGGTGNDRLFGGRGDDAMSGAAGDDTFSGLGGRDSMLGGAGEDLLEGHGGQDSLAGGADADTLLGGPAIDYLSGGGGADTLDGGPGRDKLIGGPDGDTFQIDHINHGLDRIQDYAPGEGDVLDLSAVLDFSSGDEPNDFVQLNAVNGNTNVDVNPDGAGGDFTTVFRLLGVTGLNLETLVGDGNVQLEQPTS